MLSIGGFSRATGFSIKTLRFYHDRGLLIPSCVDEQTGYRYYDGEYRENDADIEACVPVSQKREAEGISVRELPGGRCLTLLHKGPYEELGRSYSKILEHVEKSGREVVLPTREVYLKGPGMIFRGNSRKYLTEIQMLIKE